MKIRCVWEHNGSDSILYADNFVGAFTRGSSQEEAKLKMPEEIRRFQLWIGEAPADSYEIEIVQEKESDLQVKDADSDVIFETEETPLSAGEYQYLKSVALTSAEAFLRLYIVPRQKQECKSHTKDILRSRASHCGRDVSAYEKRKRILFFRNRG